MLFVFDVLTARIDVWNDVDVLLPFHLVAFKYIVGELSRCEDEDNEYEDMFVKTAFQNIEWGGPLRGGRLPEPTRFGDWERKGRCTDY